MENYYDKIIENIETQRYYLRARYNIEPNKLILGTRICSILDAEARMVKWSNPELSKSGVVATLVGLPITIDRENIWTVEVCFELEQAERNFVMPSY